MGGAETLAGRPLRLRLPSEAAQELRDRDRSLAAGERLAREGCDEGVGRALAATTDTTSDIAPSLTAPASSHGLASAASPEASPPAWGAKALATTSASLAASSSCSLEETLCQASLARSAMSPNGRPAAEALGSDRAKPASASWAFSRRSSSQACMKSLSAARTRASWCSSSRSASSSLHCSEANLRVAALALSRADCSLATRVWSLSRMGCSLSM